MNSIEIANKLIEENDSVIEEYRDWEKEQIKLVEEAEEQLKEAKATVERLEKILKLRCDQLQQIRDEKKEFLVYNTALKMFIANGGGLDMLVD